MTDGSRKGKAAVRTNDSVPLGQRLSLTSLATLPESGDAKILTSSEVELLYSDAKVRWPPRAATL